MAPFKLFLSSVSAGLLWSISFATISTPAMALPDQVFWDHNDWPSDLESTGSGSPLLEGTVLFAQAQIIPSKHGVDTDVQPHLVALKKTLVMLRPHDITDQSVGMELTVRDADGNLLSGSQPIAMEVPENIPKQEGWVDFEDFDDIQFPTSLANPYVVQWQENLNTVGDDPEAVGLTNLLNNEKSEIEIRTADGSWMNDFYLPNGSDVPSDSKIQFACDSTWGITVHYMQAGSWKEKTLSRGDVFVLVLSDNKWLTSENLEEYIMGQLEFPTALDSPLRISGQSSLDTIGEDPDSVGLTSLLNNDSNEIEIITGNGSWLSNFYLPNGSDIPSDSKIQVTCNSAWGINIFYPNPQRGTLRRKRLEQGDVLVIVLVNGMWLASEDLEHNEYVFGHNFYTAILDREWVSPGMTLEFAASSGEQGVLEADVGGVTELVITTLDAGFLTEPRNEFQFKDDPTTNTEYFETAFATRLIVAQYETMQFDEIVLPDGKTYNSVSDDEGGVYSGDMRQHVGKILLSHGIDLANYGISSSLAQSESPHVFTCALLAAHNTVGMYQNGRVVHGLSGGNGMITLYDSIGNEMSHEIGHNYELGHYVGGFEGSVHRGADEINSSWAWDSRTNIFLPNFSPSDTGRGQCLDGKCQTPFLGKYQYGTDAMAGGEPFYGSNRFTMYTPYVSKKIQDFMENKAIWDPSSSTGFRKYNPSTRQMDEYTNYDNGQKVPRLYRVPVTTIVGYYDPDLSRSLETYIYPAMHGAYGFVYNDDGGSTTGTSNGCELVVETKNGKLVFDLDTSIDSNGMNKFHVNVATEEEPREAWIYCMNNMLHTRSLDGPKADQPALTYTVNGIPFANDVSPTETPVASPTQPPTEAPVDPPTNPPTEAPIIDPPTFAPTPDDGVCEDDPTFLKRKKNCERYLRKLNKREFKCNKPHKGDFVYDWCPATCALVGLGPCA